MWLSIKFTWYDHVPWFPASSPLPYTEILLSLCLMIQVLILRKGLCPGPWSGFLFNRPVILGLGFKPTFYTPQFPTSSSLNPRPFVPPLFMLGHPPLDSQYQTLLLFSCRKLVPNNRFYQFVKRAIWHLLLISQISSYHKMLTSHWPYLKISPLELSLPAIKTLQSKNACFEH